MEKRAFIAVALSFVILITWQYFVLSPKIVTLESQGQGQEGVTLKSNGASQNATEVTNRQIETPTTSAEPTDKVNELAPPEHATSARFITIETPLYKATFTTRGAVPDSFELKNYTDENGKGISLLRAGSKVPALAMGDSRDFVFAKYDFKTTAESITLKDNDTAELVFTFEQNGVSIRRTYKFSGNSRRIDLKDDTTGLREYYITTGSDFGIFGTEGVGTHVGSVILQEADRVDFQDNDDINDVKTYMQNIKWVAQEDKYFCAAILPTSNDDEAIAWKKDGDVLVALRTNRAVNNFIIYAGPKKYDDLKLISPSLVDVIDFGFFSIVAWPIFWILLYLDGFIKNYGWSIIALTILVRVPFIPLVNKGQRSMKKLQKLKPLMDELRERYKKDPQKMQKETMELYRKHKVNPMGGCLPILIQIPVFFALYKVLFIAIELRGAPWMFWIKDLSMKDPYYVLPIIMGASMFIQQKMTPTTMDPMQAKIMNLMPIIFTFMFLSFPSGLVIYWLVSNVLSISQQYYINNKAE
ncbi:MAG: membrane protein insertase YidC [Candidatus Magnetoovum sp. WYHC-5]|nr:membrane protein insertase YidC [Candidatus Magnetoovum sp. WYHC-5]